MALALALNDLSVPCAVYEMRSTHSASKTSSGALMLSPNALKVLDGFGLLYKLKEKSYPFEWVYYKDADEQTIDRYPLGGEAAFGYKAFRIYRQELLEIMYQACFDRNIPVHFNKKFSKVVDETESGVEFEFADGSVETAAMLVGSDGIHSKLRDYVCPGVEKKFMGMAALTWETPTKQLRIPEEKDYKFPVSILTAHGVFVMAPQKPDGSAMLSGTQFRIEEKTREGWEELIADKQGLMSVVRKNMEVLPDIVQSNLEDINADSMNMWTYYSIPRLESWTSKEHHRVVILGDAAHAVPPTTGNGAAQAFEDAISLALLISIKRENRTLRWEHGSKYWQKIRQDRIDQLLSLTKQLNNKRLPLDKQKLLDKDELWFDESAENPGQMAWLYVPGVEDKVKSWAEECWKEM